MRVINSFSLFIVLLILLSGCKKEGDSNGPEVEWSLPQQFSSISSVDTFLVQANISDADGVTRVSVNLTDQMGTSLASMGDEFPNQTNYSLNKNFYLNLPDLSSGTYYLNLEAYDETNKTSVFREITVNPIPWELLATVVAYGNESNSQIGFHNEENAAWTNILSNAGDVINLEANHEDGLVMVITGESGSVTAIAYPGFGVQWNFEIPGNSSLKRIESADFNAELGEMIVADTDQNMYLLNQSGGMILGFNTNLMQHQAVKTLMTPKRIYAIERKMDNSNQEFSEFYRVSGALKYRQYFPGDVVKMFEEFSSESLSEHDEVVIFVNDNGTPRLKIFDKENPGFSEPLTLPSGELNAVCRISQRRYLFQIDETIYHYNFNGSVNVYYSGPVFRDLIYDPVNDEVLGLSDEAVHYFGFQNGVLQELGTQPANNVHAAVLLRNR